MEPIRLPLKSSMLAMPAPCFVPNPSAPEKYGCVKDWASSRSSVMVREEITASIRRDAVATKSARKSSRSSRYWRQGATLSQ